ncbi:MAG: DUF799 family lipoprotein [Deltaproteobacteria bacterium]|nr:DUF799 family lipoprotein [Deltaproteobacteria bacterium]MBW2137547.1 DUF799 family lipoprotein [Deltaproteobacteria bacterium]
MKTYSKPLLILHVFLFISLGMSACAPRKTKTTLDRVYELDPSGRLYVSPEYMKTPPRSLAVMPFRSLVGEGRVEGSEKLLLEMRGKEEATPGDLAQEMRMTFYGQLAQLPFELIHPTRVDKLLREKRLGSWDELRALKPDEMKELFNVDALVFGEVTHFDYYYAFLYTQLAAGIRIEMISTRTGELLWRFQDARRDHTVRVALDPISLAVGLFQAGFSLRAINMTRAMDEICREAVAHIPFPKENRGPRVTTR